MHEFAFHRIGLGIPILIGFLFLVVVNMAKSRRGGFQQSPPAGGTNPSPTPASVGICQRCRTQLPVEAAYCAHCGLPVARPTPLPMPRQRASPGGTGWLAFAIALLFGLIALGAVLFMAESPSVTAPPQPPQPAERHAPSDPW